MSAADKALALGITMMKAATPDGDTFPRDENEWSKAVAAVEQLGYAMYLEMGMQDTKARALARMTHGGQVGRTLLEIAKRNREMQDAAATVINRATSADKEGA